MRYLSGILAALMLLAPLSVSAQQLGKPFAGMIRVRLVTSDGPIIMALDARRAPKTTANFLAYVDDGRLDGTSFYRAARRKDDPHKGFVQGGIGTDARRMLDPLPFEPTSKTGIRHLDATISMARGPAPESGTANFSILVGSAPDMDAHGTTAGYAAFGHVVAGMDVVRRILAEPSGGGEGEMLGQMIVRPVRLISARRIDGTPHPSGRPKPWLLFEGR